MPARFNAALGGRFDDYVDEERHAVEAVLTTAMRRRIRALEREIEAEMRRAGLGRLARAPQSRAYPASGSSLGPAGIVWMKGGRRTQGAVRAFDEGARIRSPDGFFIAIPTDNAPKKGIGGGRISPSNWPDSRFGKLRFVYRRTGPSLLVVDGARASFSKATGQLRGFRRASARAQRTGTGLTTVVMFVLLPEAKMPKLYDIDRIVAAHRDLLIREISDNLS